MLETAIVVAIIVCASTVVAYISYLLYNSKCTSCKVGCVDGMQVTRDPSQEHKVPSFRLRLPMFGK